MSAWRGDAEGVFGRGSVGGGRAGAAGEELEDKGGMLEQEEKW